MHIFKQVFTFSLLFYAHLSANENQTLQQNDSNLLIAIAFLCAVALLSIYFSRKKVANLKKKFNKQKQIAEAEDKILSEMSENIQNIAKGNVATAQKISSYDEDRDISTDIAKVVRSENKLLSITTDIIEFLRIKSKKTNIVNEKFKLSNLLNDISGTLKSNSKDIEFELIYDVKNNIPENLYGDTLNLSKIITNIVLYCVNKGSKLITLKISKNNLFNQEDHLYFEIESDLQLNVEESGNIFNSKYDEQTQSYESLGLFVANELSVLMRGELLARNNKKGNVEFLFNIPFEEDLSTEKSTASVSNKKVLIIDSVLQSATVTKNLLTQLGHSSKLTISEHKLVDMPKFSNYDLSIIEDKLLTKDLIEKAKDDNCKVISITNLFTSTSETTLQTDVQLIKPLIKKQLSHAIDTLFSPHLQKASQEENKKEAILVYKNVFQNTPNIDLQDFTKFRNTKVLLVEDNLINQKVFVGMLAKSGMPIDVANDGQEALDMLAADSSYNIIFMDINMPIMDGYTASVKIRQNTHYDNIPIVALTALTSAIEIEKTFACKMNGFLPKPLKKEQLYTVFSMFIQETAPERRAQSREEIQYPLFESINVEVGIANSSANEVFYKEILLEFKDAYGESAKVFEKLILDFRYEQLKMLCVDVKGLSASIGAENMNKLITDVLQALLYKKHELIPEFIPAYKHEMDKINQSIESYAT